MREPQQRPLQLQGKSHALRVASPAIADVHANLAESRLKHRVPRVALLQRGGGGVAGKCTA